MKLGFDQNVVFLSVMYFHISTLIKKKERISSTKMIALSWLSACKDHVR